MVDKDSILLRPISDFALSKEFEEMVRMNNFRNLYEITSFSSNHLLKLPYFNYHVLEELITILKFYKLESMLSDV